MPPRTVRVTLRCITDDLDVPVPPLDEEIGAMDHPLMAEARRVAPVAEESQDRILAIDSPLVYKIRHSRWRGATWLERSVEIFWLLGGAIREEGSSADPYVHFVALHSSSQLLPGDDDRLRERAEGGARLLRTLRSSLRENLQTARTRAGEDHRFVAERLSMRFHVVRDEDWEEIWLAIRTVDVEGNGVKEEVRSLTFALLEEVVGEAEWELQARWPTGTIHGSEVAKLGLRVAGDEED